MTEAIKSQIEEFRKKTELFANGEMNVKEYKGFSGKFGSYAQKGAHLSMLRLRITGGQLSQSMLKAIISLCDKYNIDRLHCTTCQTIQLHDIPVEKVADVMTDAIESGFYTLGGGGDFPRNVMVSPLSGVEKGENFDVTPYAKKAGEYLISQIDAVKMPRKLKVCFSNSEENAVHATFRDIGFVSRADGLFDVYCAGGMGLYPRMGVKAAECVKPSEILYCIKAMISLFCKYGNYENRAKARTRFIQDKLGDDFVSEYRKHLDAAAAEGGLTIDARAETVSKKGAPSPVSSRRVIAQKQDGLYTVKYHPLGGNLSLQSLKNICGAISDMEDVSLRLSPDETIYIINCSGDEVRAVLDATDDSAQSDIEESVSCIGASVCQQGLRNSQELLGNILDEVKKHSFSPDALPQLHISGCMSSCGTHQIGSIGFHGKVKIIDKKPFPAFSISINGCEKQGAEHFGEDMGVMLTEDIPKFIAELGETVTNSGMSYNDFTKANPAVLTELIKKYV